MGTYANRSGIAGTPVSYNDHLLCMQMGEIVDGFVDRMLDRASGRDTQSALVLLGQAWEHASKAVSAEYERGERITYDVAP